MFADELAALPAKAFAQGNVGGELAQALAQPGQIARTQQESCFIVAADFASAVAIKGHDGPGSGERLRQCAGQAFS